MTYEEQLKEWEAKQAAAEKAKREAEEARDLNARPPGWFAGLSGRVINFLHDSQMDDIRNAGPWAALRSARQRRDCFRDKHVGWRVEWGDDEKAEALRIYFDHAITYHERIGLRDSISIDDLWLDKEERDEFETLVRICEDLEAYIYEYIMGRRAA